MSDSGAGENNQSEPVGGKQTRQRSAVAFSYIDLQDTMAVATAIHENVGTGDCDDHQLAAWLKKSVKSSGFRLLLSTARMFGLTEIDPTGKTRLAPLGRCAVDPTQAREARVRAFLTVPLYDMIFEKYKGGVLPPPAALEREMAQIGVAEKQIRHARLVMESSAQYAGFFEHGKDRLVMPGIAPAQAHGETVVTEKDSDRHGGGGGGGDDLPPLDGLILALVKKLPPAGTADWKAADRAMWLQMAAMAFQMAYGPAGHIEIKAVSESPAIPIRNGGSS